MTFDYSIESYGFTKHDAYKALIATIYARHGIIYEIINTDIDTYYSKYNNRKCIIKCVKVKDYYVASICILI